MTHKNPLIYYSNPSGTSKFCRTKKLWVWICFVYSVQGCSLVTQTYTASSWHCSVVQVFQNHLLLFYHLSLRVLEALGLNSVLIQPIEQVQRVEDSLVGVILIQWLLSLVDLSHILQEKNTFTLKGLLQLPVGITQKRGCKDTRSTPVLFLICILSHSFFPYNFKSYFNEGLRIIE